MRPEKGMTAVAFALLAQAEFTEALAEATIDVQTKAGSCRCSSSISRGPTFPVHNGGVWGEISTSGVGAGKDISRYPGNDLSNA